ncbi:hypothetical protein MMA231_02464 [Asticcacaulis sp. MM231]|uniref:hypothetical protein n=1 Tax=Asticcacaulis sp. MM231 TaxID=3157666 RepID=UPI0032D59AD4
MRMVKGTIDAISAGIETDSYPVNSNNKTVGRANLLKPRQEIGALTKTTDEYPLIAAADHGIVAEPIRKAGHVTLTL